MSQDMLTDVQVVVKSIEKITKKKSVTAKPAKILFTVKEKANPEKHRKYTQSS